jgi:hypothetical protein
MTFTQISSQIMPLNEDFIQAIKDENPFDRRLFIKQQHIWDRKFFDVPELNAVASNSILQAVEQIRIGRKSTSGIALTAERGLGKSHIISRIRHKLLVSEIAFFIYMGEYTNLNRIKEEFLQAVSYSLKHSMRSEYMQWQELATLMFNRATEKQWAAKHVVDEWVPKQLKMCQENGRSLLPIITHLQKKFLEVYSNNQNPYLIQAIFWTLSKPYAATAINWIAGNGITPAEATLMGLPISNEETDNFNAFSQSQEILNLLGEFMPVVICLDELDSLGQTENSAEKPRMVASLGKDILNILNRGVVLTTIFPQTWASHIKTMPQAESVVDRIGESVIELQHLNPQGVTALVSAWLDDFYSEKDYVPLTPIYPFTTEEMQIIGDERPTFRAALQDCRQIFGEKIKVKPKEHPVRVAYEEELKAIQANIDNWIDDSTKVAGALWLGFYASIGQTVGDIKVNNIEKFMNLKAVDQGYLDFKITAKENGVKTARIGVSIVQMAGGNGLTAGLRRLVDYDKFEISRGCLVRSKTISSAAKQAHQLVTQLIGEKKGEWISFLPEHVAPLLAIAEVHERQEDYELTEAEILDFINHQGLAIDNPLLEEILSKPTGKVPKGLTDSNELMNIAGSQTYEVIIPIIEKGYGYKQEWIYDITKRADRSVEEDLGTKTNYQAGTDFEIITRTSLEFLGFTVDSSHRGGAGGLDLCCSHPFTLIAECKSGKSIPSGSVEQLLKLGRMHVGKEMSAEAFDALPKLIIGPGKHTPDLTEAAESWKVSIISANALQKLVEIRALYPGAFTLQELCDCFEPGLIDELIDDFIDKKILGKLDTHSKVMALVQKIVNAQTSDSATAESLLRSFRSCYPEIGQLGDHEFHDILIELASPLVGYLKREKAPQKWADRFYFLRELQVN